MVPTKGIAKIDKITVSALNVLPVMEKKKKKTDINKVLVAHTNVKI